MEHEINILVVEPGRPPRPAQQGQLIITQSGATKDSGESIFLPISETSQQRKMRRLSPERMCRRKRP